MASSALCIITPDRDLAQAIRLEVETADLPVTLADDPTSCPAAALYLIDADCFPLYTAPTGRTIRFGRAGTDIALRRPFSLSALRPLLCPQVALSPAAVRLMPDCHSLWLGERFIPLSVREYALLEALHTAQGEPVPQQVLYARLWQEKGDAGAVAVYIHHLREKLEIDGKRRIFSLRGRGYALRWAEGETV